MSQEAATPATPKAPPTTQRTPAPSHDSHLFDRLSVLYRYRWASITIFVLAVGWVMIDSYSRTPMYRATAQVLIEDPNTDLATPSEIARTVTYADPVIYLETQLRVMRGRDLGRTARCPTREPGRK